MNYVVYALRDGGLLLVPRDVPRVEVTRRELDSGGAVDVRRRAISDFESQMAAYLGERSGT